VSAPKCFDGPRQFAEWERHEAEAHALRNPPVDFCSDCTPQYKSEMVKAGRCEFPHTLFVTIGAGDDAELVGKRGFSSIPTPQAVLIAK
jgi:hypothetical protein